MSTYTNDFKDMADLDPQMSRKLQREVLLAAVTARIFCPITGKLLDRKHSVLVMSSGGASVVMDADAWDGHEDEVAEIITGNGNTMEVYDGRELW